MGLMKGPLGPFEGCPCCQDMETGDSRGLVCVWLKSGECHLALAHLCPSV